MRKFQLKGDFKKSSLEEKAEQKQHFDLSKFNPSIEVLQIIDNSDPTGSNERDIELWIKIKKGDMKALGDLYDIYISVLFPYGMAISSNKGLVMDSIHDLFVNLFKYRKKLAEKPQVKHYLLKSLKRMIYKKSEKKETAFEKVGENNLLNIDFFESSVEKKLIDSENVIGQKQRVTKALSCLSKKQKMAIQLRFFQGKSYEEIAGLMNVTVATSRTLIYRSMIKLREVLAYSSLMLLFSLV